MAKGYNRPMGGGGAGGGGGMMAQIKKMQEQMAAAQEELAVQTVTSSVGGGAIKITMTGDQHCTNVEIDPELLKDADAEMLQDLILSGINQSLDDSRKMAEDKMAPLTGGLAGMGF
jgi:DNA-binding YbaB/EbfC family protein